MISLRNASCDCGSGLRYKHCCGATDLDAFPAPARLERRRNAALASELRGDFCRAIETYEAILRDHPGDWCVAHMRATCFYQLGAMDEACTAFLRLLDSPASRSPGFWTNLGLLIAAVGADHSSPAQCERIDAYRRFRPYAKKPVAPMTDAPAVSVVMPAYMHAPYVGEAIASVFGQTRLPVELIVIDDGSRDATLECSRRALENAPIPVRLIARENRGAAATLNEGIGLARGSFVQLLNSDDRLRPRRIEAMLGALLAFDADWGYARVAPVDRFGQPFDRVVGTRAGAVIGFQDTAVMSQTLGLALLRTNSAISSGNLMFRKRLWETLGGFRDYRYNHDWDFCLRAWLECEPVLVPEPIHGDRLRGVPRAAPRDSGVTAPLREHRACGRQQPGRRARQRRVAALPGRRLRPGRGAGRGTCRLSRAESRHRRGGHRSGTLSEELRQDLFARWQEDSGQIFGVPMRRTMPGWPASFFFGGNTSIKKAKFDALGGFNEHFPYDALDDHEFGLRWVASGGDSRLVAGAVAISPACRVIRGALHRDGACR